MSSKECINKNNQQEKVAYGMNYALNNVIRFVGLSGDYVVVDPTQVQRALSNLDVAIFKFNKIFAAANLPDRMRTEIDGVFTALSNMQRNLEKAVTSEIDKEKQ